MAQPELSIPGVELLGELGRGAHSAVFRARRGGRYYAVKVPEAAGEGLPSEQIMRRFRREAVALARVKHSALPSVMEVGSVDGVPYIVMELAAGETLEERLRQGPLEPKQIVELARQLADALSRTHDAGLVHRDIKPSNILFDSRTSAVRLVDFGLAGDTLALAGEDETSDPGSHRRSLDARGDLFALGCVLFECMAGAAPFSAVDPGPLLARHEESPALPPVVSRNLADILRRLLGVEGATAYSDAHALLADLRRLREPGATISVRPEPRSTRLRQAAPVPLLGREREAERLRAAGRASAAGRGQVVLVRGSRGAGKTRLLQHFLEEIAAEGRHAYAVSCEPSTLGPFRLVRELLESHLGEYETLPPAKRLAKIGAFREHAGAAAPLLRVLSPRLARVFADAPALPRLEGVEHVFAESIAELLERLLADDAPVTVVIDDVQWLDAGSRRVVVRLVDRAPTGVMFLLAARDDADSWAGVERLMRSLEPERVWELPLDPFDEERVHGLARAYLGEERLDAELLRYITGLSDGTPLGVLETIRSMLDGGVLTPYWGTWRFDREAAQQIGLPRGSLELLSRRFDELSSNGVELLTAGAVIGTRFDDELVGRVAELGATAVRNLLADARRAILVEPDGRGHRFVHDAVREALLARLEPAQASVFHERVAEALDCEGGVPISRSTAAAEPISIEGILRALDDGTAEFAEAGEGREIVIARATHYLAGEPGKRPARVLSACRAAAELTFRVFDNELSLRFFAGAEAAANLLGDTLDLAFQLMHAEALIRTGAFEAGIARFRAVETQSADPVTRAFALYRAAWAEMQIDLERSWATLESAFRALSVSPPSGTLLILLRGVFSWLRWRLWPIGKSRAGQGQRRLEVLSALCFQAGRVGFHTSNPLRLISAALLGLVPAERLGTPAALSRAYSHYGVVLTALGFRRAGRRRLELAQRHAVATHNPLDYAQVLQLRGVAEGIAGEQKASLALHARLMDEFGHWRELSEYCAVAYGQQMVEALRGRNLTAWKCLERAVVRLSRHEGPAPTLTFIDVGARAALLSLGRRYEAESREFGQSDAIGSTGMFAAYGSRVRLFTESGELGPAFEAYVEQVRNARPKPSAELAEYRVHVAHARVHACLYADSESLPACREALDVALRDLKRVLVIPLLRAHGLAIEAFSLLFAGRFQKMERLLHEAEVLANEQGAPFVLYAVHRCRAHRLKRAGDDEAARDEARMAEALAREHGAAFRLRWIRQEFGLKAGSPHSTSSSSDRPLSPGDSMTRLALSRPRGYLRSLVRLSEQGGRELEIDDQVRAVLDELIESLRAERGFLFLTHEELEDVALSPELAEMDRDLDDGSGLSGAVRERLDLAACRAGGQEVVQADGCDSRLIEDLFEFGSADGVVDDPVTGRGSVIATYAERAVLAAPLSVRGQRIGVVYLDRPLGSGGFSALDARSLLALAAQVPLVFELARTLRTRERVEETQRSAEKLEAIGRLAGGIAHDFNNMLSVILAASEQISTQKSSRPLAEDVGVIVSAAERARDLTRQLLAFSRGQYLNPEILELNETIARLEPMFRRLLGDATVLEFKFDGGLGRVKADPGQIDQVLTNLVVNAHDAMPDGGRLSIETATVMLREGEEQLYGLKHGRYAVITVSDTGHGMDDKTLAKIFEPFFTTKDSGSGLGLATAYGIVAQSGGYIDVDSQVGFGTTFRIFLPEAHAGSSMPPSGRELPGGPETVLLIDDEPMARESTRRMLASLGYRVVSAKNSEEALEIAAERLHEVDLIVSDVVMPGMNGLELARELCRLQPGMRVLFISGYTAGVLTERGVLRDAVSFLQKPLVIDTFATRVRALLDEED
jgi:signal transduction histidine kinase/ActR/RegA family two-component response regulator